MMLNTDILVNTLRGQKLNDFDKDTLYAKLMYSLNQSQLELDDFDIEISRLRNTHQRTNGIEVLVDDRLEVYRFEEEGLTIDISNVDSHGFGNKSVVLPSWYNDKDLETKNMIENNPELIKEQMMKELDASDTLSINNPIHLHLDRMEWEGVEFGLDDLDFYVSKESMLELFNGKEDDDLILGSVNIEFKREEVIMSSDMLTVEDADDEEPDSYLYGFMISTSRKIYEELESISVF